MSSSSLDELHTEFNEWLHKDLLANGDVGLLPRLAVFDLDFTVWHPEMYELDGAPFSRRADGSVVDCSGTEVMMFPGMAEVFGLLTESTVLRKHMKIAVASRTTYPSYAYECMKHLSVHKDGRSRLAEIVHYEEIYPSKKVKHFKSLAARSGHNFADMIFFDNEYRNCRDVGKLGVTTVYTPDGMTLSHWYEGLKTHAVKKMGLS